MVYELARDAVHIKMKLPFPSVFTSEYEYSYAAGYICRVNSVSEAEAAELRNLDSFSELKARTERIAAGENSRLSGISGGDKLLQMILNCQYEGKINDDTRHLFDMGYYG